MKNFLKFAALAVIALSSCSEKEHEAQFTYSINWENKNVRHDHFVDLGNYVLLNDPVDFKEFERLNETFMTRFDYFKPSCTATIKRNKKGEVIVGRNMDVEISQNPAIITPIVGGKYKTVSFTYVGSAKEFSYSTLDFLDKNPDYLAAFPFMATDSFNEKGLYVEADMREMDDKFDFYCHGTNPGKPRASLLSVMSLIAVNCATVEEAVEFVANSYSWCTPSFTTVGDGFCIWNLAVVVGDATGNYGLIEFARDSFRFTPYANGQGNYYIHPDYAEYAVEGTGYGRLSAALKGLPECETDLDMMKNMEACMWKKEIQDPGCLGYSDYMGNVNDRRAHTEEEMHEGFVKYMAPYQEAANEYYQGNEQPLRDAGNVWTTSFNFGVNCAQKHLYLRLWEKDNVIFECQWE